MSLADVIHTGVAVANRLTQSEGMQVTVQHAAATDARDDNGRPVFAAAVDRTGLLHAKPRRVLDTTGAERMSRAQLVVLGPVAFNTEDRVTLPVEGTRPILQVEALLDAEEQPYLTTLYFG